MPGSYEDLVPGPDSPGILPGVYRARVSKRPDASGQITVTLENYTRYYEFEVPRTNWVGSTAPVGEVVPLIVDDDHDGWVPIPVNPAERVSLSPSP